jgi:transcriptional regulator with XRE-family HTH domain
MDTTPTHLPRSVADQVFAFRKEAKLTQRALAKKAGLSSHSRVAAVERGEDCRLTILNSIAHALGRPIVVVPGMAFSHLVVEER